MRTWRSVEEVPSDLGAVVVSVGVFDGVHRGHREVLRRAVRRASELGLPAVAVTFDPHPVEVVRPGTVVPRLATLDRRVALLGEAGVDDVLVLPFTVELAARSAQEFAEEVLRGRLHARAVVVGADFRFGHRAGGDVGTLRELGFEVGAVEAVGAPDRPRVSSTGIRAALEAGDLRTARADLGHPHVLDGVVVRGDQRGRELGYPTANVQPGTGLLVPADGVYAGRLLAEGHWLPAAVSIGTNPTFDGVDRRVEAYVLDRNDLDLYDQPVAVDLVERLRPTERFDGVEALVAQMGRDVERARAVLAAEGPLLR